jgi:cell wall-associated NlpC family hydrolase
MDRRLTPATDRMAHHSLIGRIQGRTFTQGEARMVVAALVDLQAAPNGARDRQLWLGDLFTVIDRRDGHAFGMVEKDGYCGWLPEAALGDPVPPTHWIAVPGSHLYDGARVQARDLMALPMGARVTVTGQSGAFSQTSTGFVPTAHLRAIGAHFDDPVAIAERMLGTPYLWGGNSRGGMDCSGLVQLAYLTCGRPCPADSDLQQGIGTTIAPDARPQRGDLLFWRGHVAIAVDHTRLIHANAHTMSVAYEPITDAIARIAEHGGGAVLQRRRP